MTLGISNQSKAVLLMLLTLFCFSLMDSAAKSLTQQVGLAPTLWARYAGQTLLVLLLVSRRPGVWKATYPKLQIARSVLLLSATAFFFSALARMDLAAATAVMNVNPVLITLGGGLLLREGLGPRRIMGVLVSLGGALLVIQPGSDVFQPAMVLPLLGAICYSAYALVTRFVGHDEDVWTSLLYTGIFGGLITSVVLPFYWVPPDGTSILLMVGIAAAGTMGQISLIRAFSLAEAASIAPFSYSSLIYAMIWSILFFGVYPDQMTVLGALVISASGIYVWHRETRTRNRT